MSGQPRDAAIFVGGLPRSGTSLMRDILGSHPDVAMFLGELPLWRELASAHAGRSLARAADRDALIRDLVTHPRMQHAQMTLDGGALAAALAREPAVSLGTVFAHALRQYARREGKPRWGVKDPRNEFHADQILAEFPAARVVHMLRDPRDVIASQRAMWGSRAQHIVSTTHDWRRSAALARRHQAVHRGSYAVVRYEDLVLDPARVVRDLCRTLDLDYRPAMLDLAGKPRWPEGEGDDSAARHLGGPRGSSPSRPRPRRGHVRRVAGPPRDGRLGLRARDACRTRRPGSHRAVPRGGRCLAPPALPAGLGAHRPRPRAPSAGAWVSRKRGGDADS